MVKPVSLARQMDQRMGWIYPDTHTQTDGLKEGFLGQQHEQQQQKGH